MAADGEAMAGRAASAGYQGVRPAVHLDAVAVAPVVMSAVAAAKAVAWVAARAMGGVGLEGEAAAMVEAHQPRTRQARRS